ncbi:DUF2490 domain-containing protein [Dokdonia sinensis]|uniref:DUF2490 domain-containing protein n=1 Tax=Dokdonia sinensis TaxID=2479847 RepID=A0A3M0GDP4_9FLAO|nr:DUF2490 domain-containing protein [Dokdonia sinensis]RMB63281.1 DUF2490 domain-containing protein [Dokdonia sinensis]
MNRYVFIFIFGVFTIAGMCAQGTYEVGAIPEFNLGVKLSEVWKMDVEFAPRIEAFSGDFDGNSETDIFFDLLDVTSVLNRTVGVDAKAGMGYLARFERERVVHRFLQQYSFTNPHYGYRLGHRFRIDQTFRPDEKFEFRARYRLSSDISLNGEFIDPGEIYIKLGNEYIGSWQDGDSDLEIRVVPSLGYYFDDAHKLELGVDYRIDSFLNATASHRFWLSVGYYLSL